MIRKIRNLTFSSSDLLNRKNINAEIFKKETLNGSSRSLQILNRNILRRTTLNWKRLGRKVMNGNNSEQRSSE